MARVRRYRRPVRRLRRGYRRSFRRRIRRVAKRNLRFKFTKVDSLDVTLNDNHSYWINFTPDSLPEYVQLAPNFECCKFTKVVVRVMPMQNVSNNTTSQMPAYCMVPWKDKPSLLSKGFSSIMSVDKARMYRGTACGRQTYIPACHSYTYQDTTATEKSSPDRIVYRPVIRFTRANNDIDLYCGLIMFQGFADMAQDYKAHYNIKIDVYGVFYNQSTINI